MYIFAILAISTTIAQFFIKNPSSIDDKINKASLNNFNVTFFITALILFIIIQNQ
jgi:hypothetical protein